MERNEVIIISLTDTEAMKKEALSPNIQIHAAVIALCIGKNTLAQIRRSQHWTAAPYFPSDHKGGNHYWQKRKKIHIK